MMTFCKNSLLILLISLFVLSCSNDNDDTITPPDESLETKKELKAKIANYAKTKFTSDQEDEYLEDIECFKIKFPYTLTDGENETVINSEEELQNFFEQLEFDFSTYVWHVFPITVIINKDKTEKVITNDQEFHELIISCYEDVDVINENDCFTLDFPITIINCQDNETVVNNYDELYSHPYISGFVYPISVTLTDGTKKEITSDEDFDKLYNDCYDIEDCTDCTTTFCFKLIYPLNFVKEDGAIIEVNNDEELFNTFENLEEDEFISITYPMNIELEDGTKKIINNDEELNTVFENCNFENEESN